MNMRPIELKDRLLKALADLPGLSIVDVQVEPTLQDGQASAVRPDLVVRVTAHGVPASLFVELKAAGYPRDVKQAVDRLRRYMRASGNENARGVLAAPAITPASRSILSEAGIGYFDMSGSLLIALPRSYWMISLPRKTGADRTIRSLFTGKRTQVLLQILSATEREWHVDELAGMAGVAIGTAHQVLSELERHLWVRREGRGPNAVRIVTEPGQILDAWARAHSLDQYSVSTFFHLAATPGELRHAVAQVLADGEAPYVVSFESGAMLAAPHLTAADQLQIIVPKGNGVQDRLLRNGFEPVSDGANVVLYATTSATPFMQSQDIGGVRVASDIQLYLDLRASAGRAREQAEFLRKERIGF